MCIIAACNGAFVYMVKPTINMLLVEKNQKLIVVLPAALFCISCVKGITEYYQIFIVRSISQKVLSKIQIELFSHLLHSDVRFIESFSSARLLSRFTNDITLMKSSVVNLLLGSAKHLLTVILLIVIMFYNDPTLSFFTFFIFPTVIYPVQIIGKKIRDIVNDIQNRFAYYTSKLDESFQAIRIVKSFAIEKIQIKKAKDYNNEIIQLTNKNAKIDALTSPLMEILSGLAIAAILWYGAYFTIENKITPGSLFLHITGFISAYRPFKSLIQLNIHLQEGITAANRVFTILDNKAEVIDAPDAKDYYPNKIDLNVENLCYEINDKKILKGVSFYIKSGEKVAIVGKSGSGKSTIVNLILRFYQANSGRISLGGRGVEEYTLKSLHDNISLVTQDNIIFESSIKDNVTLGKKDFSITDLKKAMEDAAMSDFVNDTSEAANLLITGKGNNLSGGQKQRIAIARAFFKNSPLIIMDEATSALDLENEKLIYRAISSMEDLKTVILVTHRLSSIKHFDKIIVFKEGSVIEIGKHSDLMDARGEYYNLFMSSEYNLET